MSNFLFRTDVEHEIARERARQEAKWGEQNHDPFLYLTILTEEVGEVAKAALEARAAGWSPERLAEYRIELIQVAAVALAMVECFDRGKWKRC